MRKMFTFYTIGMLFYSLGKMQHIGIVNATFSRSLVNIYLTQLRTSVLGRGIIKYTSQISSLTTVEDTVRAHVSKLSPN